MDENTGKLYAKVYTTDGYQISLNLPASTTAEALRHLDDIRAAGLLPFMPENLISEETETIVTVVRRIHFDEKKQREVPVIDLYPAWRGNYGQFRFAHIYLDTPEQIAEFEKNAGVKLDDMPVYNGQQALKRKEGRKDPTEVTCRPFVAIKEATGTTEMEGNTYKTYRFSRYGGQPKAAPAPVAELAPEPAPAAPTQKPAAPKPQPKPAADVNPFELNEFQQALREKLAELDMTGKNGGFDYLFANIRPGQRIHRLSDLHPAMSPADVLNALPDIARRWRESQQPDPSPDDSGSRKPSAPAAPTPAQSSKPAPQTGSGSGPINSVLNPARISTRRHVLEGELIQIETIKAERERGGFGYRQNFWRGTAQVLNNLGAAVDIELNIWPEDARKIERSGHVIDWPSGANEYATFTPTTPIWVYFQKRSSGYSFSAVEPVPTASADDAQRTA